MQSELDYTQSTKLEFSFIHLAHNRAGDLETRSMDAVLEEQYNSFNYRKRHGGLKLKKPYQERYA